MQKFESINRADDVDLIEFVAQFDAGKITRTEFQQRVRALPNERLLTLSRILTADRAFGRTACTSFRSA